MFDYVFEIISINRHTSRDLFSGTGPAEMLMAGVPKVS